MKEMTNQYLKEVDAFINENAVEKIRFKPKQRKDDVTQQMLATHDGSETVLYVGVSQEKVKTWRSKGCSTPG